MIISQQLNFFLLLLFFYQVMKILLRAEKAKEKKTGNVPRDGAAPPMEAKTITQGAVHIINQTSAPLSIRPFTE